MNRSTSLRPEDRVRRRSDFLRCQRQGKRLSSSRLVLLYHRKPGQDKRLGIVITKKTGGAVVRNRWKRVIRETFRTSRDLLEKPGDYVLLVRRSLQGLPGPDLSEEVRTLFRKISAA